MLARWSLAFAVVLSGCSLFTNLSTLDEGGDEDGGPPTAPPRDDAGEAGSTSAADAAVTADATDAPSCSLVTVKATPASTMTGGGPGPGWLFNGSLATQDDVGARVDLTSNGTSNSRSELLFGTDLGFAIPLGAEVRGVTLHVRRSAPKPSNEDVRDDEVRLALNGQADGDNRAVHPWTDGFITVQYGGPTDTWGMALTPAIVNQTSFGVALRAANFGSAGSAFVDTIEVEVTFCE